MDDQAKRLTKTEPPEHLAWWSGELKTFRAQPTLAIIGALARHAIAMHRTNEADQLKAWQWEVDILRSSLAGLPAHYRLLLEYPLLRLGRRLDAVLVTDRAIFVIEFKSLASGFSRQARSQAEDYALDLRDFHAGSRAQVIIPIVVAGAGRPARPQWDFFWPDVSAVYETLPDGLADLLGQILSHISGPELDVAGWEHAAYRPVPTIIEAVRTLYRKHDVAEIKMARADVGNLRRTTAALLQAITDAQSGGRHIILFVTGIPGAGKTLCGLDAVFSTDPEASFLTGTLPMVYVLKAALAEDAARDANKKARHATRETKSTIQSITGFLRHYLAKPDDLPEHVIVFDEAQRAWDADFGWRKFQHTQSEAAIVLDIMQRHQDYAVIICLVGTGQEINTGEAGLGEWGRALGQRLRWETRAAPGVLDPANGSRQRLFEVPPEGMVIDEALHLAVPIRNIRSASAAPWVDAVLRGDAAEARGHAGDDLPFRLTRSLPELRRGLRSIARGDRRAGLVCSSGAKRLVADGLWPRFDHVNDSAVANWFLKRWPDVRASDALEVPATEFACQGLELDYVGLCWGGDFVWNGRWVVRNFSGSKWQYPRRPDALEFGRNTYRVLLTRARYETIIWVPEGDPEDATREPVLFDQVAAFLLECGVRVVANVVPAVGIKEPGLLRWGSGRD
jgi:hypothetical protein